MCCVVKLVELAGEEDKRKKDVKDDDVDGVGW